MNLKRGGGIIKMHNIYPCVPADSVQTGGYADIDWSTVQVRTPLAHSIIDLNFLPNVYGETCRT